MQLKKSSLKDEFGELFRKKRLSVALLCFAERFKRGGERRQNALQNALHL